MPESLEASLQKLSTDTKKCLAMHHISFPSSHNSSSYSTVSVYMGQSTNKQPLPSSFFQHAFL
jgi:hypothetical protein